MNLIVCFGDIVINNMQKSLSILKTFAEHKSYTMKIQKTQPGQGYHIWHAEATNREQQTVY
jgi:hypothetical protein